MAHKSSCLRDAIDAVAALHHHLATQKVHETVKILQLYSKAVGNVQKHITSNTLLVEPSLLWATFFLGLFELMRSNTGEKWLMHFLFGTCTVLRLQHPSTLADSSAVNTHRRNFFLATRIFEISRSLIYSSPSFLSESAWSATVPNLGSLQHPKEALFDLLPKVSELSIPALNFCKQMPPSLAKAQDNRLKIESLASEGLVLQDTLQRWWKETQIWNLCSQTVSWDVDFLIASAYYHGISIYLSGTYDYHMPWLVDDAPIAPILSRQQIQQHVERILALSKDMLTIGVTGIVLFFPLRVAGARASEKATRQEIMELLGMSKKRGFTVANAFVEDLNSLWGQWL